jgi:hypothetical protein
MTAPTDQFVELTHRSQEAIASAVRSWSDTVQTLAGTVTVHEPQLPDAHAAVDAAFDFAARVLADQREYAKALVAVGTRTFEVVAEQVSQATATVADATRQVPGSTSTDLVPVTAAATAAEDAPRRARAARNGI